MNYIASIALLTTLGSAPAWSMPITVGGQTVAPPGFIGPHRAGACGEDLSARLSRLTWLRGLGPARRSFRKLRPGTLSLPEVQAFLDGRSLAASGRPVLLTGNALSGKTTHLRALQDALRSKGTPYAALSSHVHPAAKGMVEIDLRVTYTQDFDVPLPPAPKIYVKLTQGQLNLSDETAQLHRAHAIVEYLEKNRASLRNRIVFIDVEINEPEFKTLPTGPTTLNLLDRIAWLQRNDQTTFVVAVRTDFLRDLARRASHQASDPFVLDEYQRVSLDPTP